MWIPEGKEDHQGGHAMTAVGYNNDGFNRNSWGNTWCNNGYCIFRMVIGVHNGKYGLLLTI